MTGVVVATNPPAGGSLPDHPPIRKSLMTGLIIAGVGLGGFSAWASLAPLTSAAMAPGVVRADMHRQTVQHLEGGIIAEILVKEYHQVKAGQVLMRLDDVQSRATFDVIQSHFFALAAQEARLAAERDGKDAIEWHAALLEAKDRPDVAEVMAGQQRIFDTRRTSLSGQIDILNQQILQQQAMIQSLKTQISSGHEQLSLINEEINDVVVLVNKGLERRARLLALKRQAAYLEGSQGDYKGRIAMSEETINEAKFQMASLQKDRDAEVATELREIQTKLAQAKEELTSAKVTLQRRDIVAPYSGRILNLRYVTTGGVVRPGDPILDIVPDNDKLIIDARLQPLDIDVVHTGLPAQVRLVAFNQRTTPSLDAKVIDVAADALTNERDGTTYYTAKVEIDSEELASLTRPVELYPGMPAEVVIVTGERTFFDYLTKPIRDSFVHAFRES